VRVTVVPAGGLGRAAPVEIDASQVFVSDDRGTVLAVSAEWGPDAAVLHSHAGLPDFNKVLAQLGVGLLTVCDRVQLPPPPQGARLVAGPEPLRA
jgi:hypothetical protein